MSSESNKSSILISFCFRKLTQNHSFKLFQVIKSNVIKGRCHFISGRKSFYLFLNLNFENQAILLCGLFVLLYLEKSATLCFDKSSSLIPQPFIDSTQVSTLLKSV